MKEKRLFLGVTMHLTENQIVFIFLDRQRFTPLPFFLKLWSNNLNEFRNYEFRAN